MSGRSESLIELAERSVRTFSARPVFGERVDGAWSWMTYAELGAHIDEIRSGLAAFGVDPGDRVAIISRNSAAWAATGYATYGRGAVFVPMYEAQRPEDWGFILRDCSASVLFVRTPEIAAIIDELRGELPALRHVITIEGAADDPASYEGLRRIGREHPVPVRHPAPDTVAGFIYTSGTTGHPKGVMLTHANITSNVRALTSVFSISPADRSLCFLPWAHILGHTCELQVLVSSGASTRS
jgi:long-chain acyl-CoA synthetase